MQKEGGDCFSAELLLLFAHAIGTKALTVAFQNMIYMYSRLGTLGQSIACRTDNLACRCLSVCCNYPVVIAVCVCVCVRACVRACDYDGLEIGSED